MKRQNKKIGQLRRMDVQNMGSHYEKNLLGLGCEQTGHMNGKNMSSPLHVNTKL